MKQITCYGSGIIGAGWATNFAMSDTLEITLYDLDQLKLDIARQEIEKNLDFLCQEGVISPAVRDSKCASIYYTSDPATALQNADFIQESGPENLEIKRKIVETIECYCPHTAIVASSTSGLLMTDIIRDAKHPERFIGAHPYNPVHLVPLVELTRTDLTDPQILQTAYDFYKSIGKEPIILRKEALGFISNRIQVALYREAVDLVTRGICSMEEIERAVCYGPGLRYALMGPNTIFQLGGGIHGLGGILHHIGATVPLWWKDMANWTDWPEGFLENAQSQMDEAIALRDPQHGRTNEEMALFRDRGLIKLLQYHGKL